MPHLTARHAERPGDDPIFALNREANERRARGETIINATVGALLEDDGSLAVLPSVVEALREVPAARGAGYAPIGGHAEYLSAVVGDLLGGTSLAPIATAVATPGGTGALRHAVTTFLDHGQSLLTSSFYWGPYATLCDEGERTLRTFAMFDAHGGFDVGAFDRALVETGISQGRLLVFLNDPCHNPTGYSLSDAEWREVRSALERAADRVPVTLLVDVAYLAYARDTRSFLVHLEALAGRVLVLFAWSASKAFTQYGLRVGALIACTPDATEREAISRAFAYASRGTWSNCNASGQLAVARCLTDSALKARVDGERERLRTLLDARVRAFNASAHAAGLAYPRYDGGFFVTVFADDAKALGERLKARGVYGVPQKGALRLGLCSVAERDIGALVSAVRDEVRA